MRQKAARVCLVVAVVWFILGAFVLGNAPEWFAVSAAFAATVAFLGVRSVRISGVVLIVVSVVVAIGAYEARQNLKARVREIQQKAGERKSSSQYRLPNKSIRRMRASRSGHWQFSRPQRLALTADARR